MLGGRLAGRERGVGVVALGGGERVQRERPGAGIAERDQCSRLELGDVATCCLRQREGGAPVVREHLGVVLRPAEALDPLGDATVLLDLVRAGDLAVRDVTHERVREGELALALDRRSSLAPNEPLTFERVQRTHGLAIVTSQGADPEHLSDDRAVVQELFLVGRQAVETGGDEALQRLRER